MADSEISRAAPVVDAVLGGRYVLVRRLAVGGMGAVWLATDQVLGRQVAVKILRDDLVDSGVFLDRFRNEARHTAALSHPGIAGVFDYGEDSDHGQVCAYLVMELVNGRPLSEVLENGPLPVKTALSVLAQTAEALHVAHVNGVIHRDIKPSNLLMLEDGSVKITDFGIARAAEAVSITEVGTIIGTAQYMSPEQAKGENATSSSDIYSLGVVGYEMLAGRPPFTASNPAALALAHVRQMPPPLPATIPPGVSALIASTLAKDPHLRPSDALALAEDARRLQGELTSLAPCAAAAQTRDADELGVPSTQLLADQPGTPTVVIDEFGIDEFGSHEPTMVSAAGLPPAAGRHIYIADDVRSAHPRRVAWLIAAPFVATVAALVVVAWPSSDKPIPVIATTTTDSAVAVTSVAATSSLPTPATTLAVVPNTVNRTPAATMTTLDKGKGHDKGKPKG
ncbi:MAG: serine/threonine-protein kinase [Ilumatobacteraceae bacterium]